MDQQTLDRDPFGLAAAVAYPASAPHDETPAPTPHEVSRVRLLLERFLAPLIVLAGLPIIIPTTLNLAGDVRQYRAALLYDRDSRSSCQRLADTYTARGDAYALEGQPLTALTDLRPVAAPDGTAWDGLRAYSLNRIPQASETAITNGTASLFTIIACTATAEFGTGQFALVRLQLDFEPSAVAGEKPREHAWLLTLRPDGAPAADDAPTLSPLQPLAAQN